VPRTVGSVARDVNIKSPLHHCNFTDAICISPSIGNGLFTHPHGLRIDDADNIWTTDDGSHLVLKLSPAGRVLLVLGRKETAAEADWLFNQPTDVAFAKNGDV
jgi:hypothetical protein